MEGVNETGEKTDNMHADMTTSDEVGTLFTANCEQFVKDFDRMGTQMRGVVQTVSQVNETNHGMSQAVSRIATLSAEVQNRMAMMNDPVAAVRGKTENLQEMLASLRTRSEEHTSERQSLMRISYAVFCLQKKQI